MFMKNKLNRIILLLCLSLFVCLADAEAAQLETITKVLDIDDYRGTVCDYKGDITGSSFSLNDEMVTLQPQLRVKNQLGYKKIAGGCIKLMSQDGSHEYVSFPIGNEESVQAYKIHADTGREFLLVKVILGAGDGSSSFVKFWLIGKNGEEYVTYATKETLDKAGLLYDDLAINIKAGQLEMMGYSRLYGNGSFFCNSKFKGRRYRRVFWNYGTVGSLYFFWDDKANWFGYRLVNV